MKKLLLLSLILLSGIIRVNAMSYQQAIDASYTKPMVFLVYAQWADNYTQYLNNFRALKKEFGEKLNYVELDIASKDTKIFNEKYHIYPKLPYVLMFRDGGKTSRYIPRDCAISDLCMIPKIKQFVER